MMLASTAKAALCLSALLAMIGCGTSNTSTAGGFGSSSGGLDATASSSGGNNGNSNGGSSGGSNGSSSGGSSGGGTACPGSCASDSDCQNSCPPVTNGGTNCCDTSSGTCFMSPNSTCSTGQTGSE